MVKTKDRQGFVIKIASDSGPKYLISLVGATTNKNNIAYRG